jgi:hypothetical protein
MVCHTALDASTGRFKPAFSNRVQQPYEFVFQLYDGCADALPDAPIM